MNTNTTAPPAEEGRIILRHQRAAFDRLLEIATTCFATSRKSIPLAIRTNSLLIGPSGSGKTFLIQAVADHLGVPLLAISVADWVLVGSNERGGINTWPAIARFLQANRRKEGVIICIDEVHHAFGDCPWERFLRVELFALCDFRVPHGLSAKIDDEVGERTFSPGDLAEIQDVLSNRTMLVGVGAFQQIWEKDDLVPIGFRPELQNPETPTLKTLTEILPIELINRFRSEILILQPLVLNDYEAMLKTMAQKVPGYLRQTFLRLGYSRLPEVARLRQGARFLEELMLDTLLAERANMRNFKRAAPQLELSLNESADDVDLIP